MKTKRKKTPTRDSEASILQLCKASEDKVDPADLEDPVDSEDPVVSEVLLMRTMMRRETWTIWRRKKSSSLRRKKPLRPSDTFIVAYHSPFPY
jgi:hypothetical protein